MTWEPITVSDWACVYRWDNWHERNNIIPVVWDSATHQYVPSGKRRPYGTERSWFNDNRQPMPDFFAAMIRRRYAGRAGI